MYKNTPERFWAKLDKTGECWLWTGGKFANGYGRYGAKRAHRVAWELTYGDIPESLLVLHHCDVRACCRPEHLFLGTQLDNMADMIAKGRKTQQQVTHCPRGHEYTEVNTRYQYKKKTGRNVRSCRACDSTHQKQYYQAHAGTKREYARRQRERKKRHG